MSAKFSSRLHTHAHTHKQKKAVCRYCYSRPKDFLEVKDLLDVLDVLFPRSIAGLAVFFRHFSPGVEGGKQNKEKKKKKGEKKKEKKKSRRRRRRRRDAAGGSAPPPQTSNTQKKKEKEKVVHFCFSPGASWLLVSADYLASSAR